jgi:hypothetical protein
MNRHRPVDGGILAARLYGSAMRLVHSGATELDEVREPVELAAGRANLLTEQATCGEAPPTTHCRPTDPPRDHPPRE